MVTTNILCFLSCSFQWGLTFQLILCQCISARGSICQHHRDLGALSCWGCTACLAALVSGYRRGDLRCPRHPPRPPQWNPPDLQLPAIQLQQADPRQHLLLHCREPYWQDQESGCPHQSRWVHRETLRVVRVLLIMVVGRKKWVLVVLIVSAALIEEAEMK